MIIFINIQHCKSLKKFITCDFAMQRSHNIDDQTVTYHFKFIFKWNEYKRQFYTIYNSNTKKLYYKRLNLLCRMMNWTFSI